MSAPMQVLSRSRKSGHVSYHPFGGYFGVPLRATTDDAHLAALLRLDVIDALGPGFDVWVRAVRAHSRGDPVTAPLDPMAEAVEAEEAMAVLAWYDAITRGLTDRQVIRNVLRAARDARRDAALARPSEEPVAWLRDDGAATSPFAKREWPELNAAFTRPVYARRPVPSEPTREGDVETIWAQAFQEVLGYDRDEHEDDLDPHAYLEWAVEQVRILATLPRRPVPSEPTREMSLDDRMSAEAYEPEAAPEPDDPMCERVKMRAPRAWCRCATCRAMREAE